MVSNADSSSSSSSSFITELCSPTKVSECAEFVRCRIWGHESLKGLGLHPGSVDQELLFQEPVPLSCPWTDPSDDSVQGESQDMESLLS